VFVSAKGEGRGKRRGLEHFLKVVVVGRDGASRKGDALIDFPPTNTPGRGRHVDDALGPKRLSFSWGGSQKPVRRKGSGPAAAVPRQGKNRKKGERS